MLRTYVKKTKKRKNYSNTATIFEYLFDIRIFGCSPSCRQRQTCKTGSAGTHPMNGHRRRWSCKRKGRILLRVSESQNTRWPLRQAKTRQSATADFALGATWRVNVNDSPNVLYLYLPHYVKTWRHPQNRKYITYCTVVRGEPSHRHR